MGKSFRVSDPGKGPEQYEDEMSEDGGADDGGARRRDLEAATSEGFASRAAARGKNVVSYFDDVAKADERDTTMPDAITRLVQSESVVVLMRSKDDGEKASSSKFTR